MMLFHMHALPQAPQQPIGWSSQLPPAASTFAPLHDALFYFVYYVCVFFFVLITAIILYSVVRYRRRREDQPPASTLTHHTGLEVTWTVIPLILVMIIFGWGWQGARDMAKSPADARPYDVVAWRWGWQFKHPPPRGQQESSLDLSPKPILYLAKGVPAVFNLRSKDVLHSFYIPAFRIKRDVLPGRNQRLWVQPTELGDYPLFCTEYCGSGHSQMIATVKVVYPEEYEMAPWRELPDHPWDRGQIFYTANCKSCHSLDGSAMVGPTFKDLYGKEETLADGSKVKVDDAYIEESVRQPQAKVVKGFENAQMTPFPEAQISKEHLGDLIHFLKSPNEKK